MDKKLYQLFNNGDNDGDIVINCDDNIKIKCHSFIFKRQCLFALASYHFNEGKINTFDLTYSSKLIRMLISKMYKYKYIFDDLSPNEIITMITLSDYLQMEQFDVIVDELSMLFESQLNAENWIELLEVVYAYSHLKQLEIKIINYIIINILGVKSRPRISDRDINSFKLLGFGYHIEFIEFPSIKFDSEKITNFLHEIFMFFKGKKIFVERGRGMKNKFELAVSRYNLDKERFDLITQFVNSHNYEQGL